MFYANVRYFKFCFSVAVIHTWDLQYGQEKSNFLNLKYFLNRETKQDVSLRNSPSHRYDFRNA